MFVGLHFNVILCHNRHSCCRRRSWLAKQIQVRGFLESERDVAKTGNKAPLRHNKEVNDDIILLLKISAIREILYAQNLAQVQVVSSTSSNQSSFCSLGFCLSQFDLSTVSKVRISLQKNAQLITRRLPVGCRTNQNTELQVNLANTNSAHTYRISNSNNNNNKKSSYILVCFKHIYVIAAHCLSKLAAIGGLIFIV